LFEDLEARLEHLESEQRRAQAEDLTRAERARIELGDRLRGALGLQIALELAVGRRVGGRLEEVGEDWVRLTCSQGSVQAWVPLDAVDVVTGLPRRARERTASALVAESFSRELRALARDRRQVRILTRTAETTCRIEAVGTDWVEVAVQPLGETDARGGHGRAVIHRGAIVLISADRMRDPDPS
jgi:hypothetical protein